MASTKRGPSAARVASSEVRCNEVGSAQCRFSSARTVGPTPTRRETNECSAAKVARWSCSGPRRTRPAPPGKPNMRANTGTRSWLPITALSALSKAGRTTSSPWSGATPIQAAKSCW